MGEQEEQVEGSAGASEVAFDPPADLATRSIRRELTLWYASNKRDLPWRRTSDPYAIWVSEAMLQQTRVETVKEYWPRFLERFPTASALAAAEEEAVLEAWSGLGYYRRARSLQAAARVIAEEHGGVFPKDLGAALDLPGVGPYTAGAVVSIAYDVPAPLVDGNVERVFARLFGMEGIRGSGPLGRACWAAAGHFIERLEGAVSPSVWNQALMELGALVCTPRAPRCEECPLASACVARARGNAVGIPRPKPRRASTEVELEIYVIERGGRWLLEQRPDGGLMGGMWQFPTVEVTSSGLFPDELAPELSAAVEPEHDLIALSHGITHHRIRARVRSARLATKGDGAATWFAPAEAADLALTGMARKVAERLAPARDPLFDGT